MGATSLRVPAAKRHVDEATHRYSTGRILAAVRGQLASSAIPVLSLLIGLALWELVGRFLLADSLFFVPVSDVAVDIVDWARSGQLWTDLRVSGHEFFLGFGFAAIAGTAFGFVVGLNRLIRRMASPWISALYATPLVAVMPFYLLVLGTGTTSKAALAATVAIFPVIISTSAGVLAVDRAQVEVGRAFAARRDQLITKVYLPATVPFMIAGLRIGLGRALTGVVVAEFFFAQAGLGHQISIAGQQFDIARLFSGVFVFAIFGVAFMGALTWLERKVAPWRTQ